MYPEPLQPTCLGGDCTIAVTDASEFRVDAVVREAGEPTAAAAAARLLVQASFGPTRASIAEALAAVGRDPAATNPDPDTAVAEAWVAAQLTEPASLLRAHFRRRANIRACKDLGTPLVNPTQKPAPL